MAPKHILVVDSDSQWGLLIKNLMSEHDVLFTTSFDEGLQFVRSRIFDLYVVETLYPGFQIALCNLIRHRDPNVPVVFCSVGAAPQVRSPTDVAGRRYYVRKPCEPHVLSDTIEACLTSAELQAMTARVAEQAAVSDELTARSRRALARTAIVHEAILNAEESMLRLKAYQAFEKAGGDRAHFDRLWPAIVEEQKHSLGYAPAADRAHWTDTDGAVSRNDTISRENN